MGRAMATKRPTRERILDTALDLFNARRYGAVTTAALAGEVGIAEGNLWYHFNDRESLLEGLFERFESQVNARLEMTSSSESALADYVEYYRTMAVELSTYRFFYRDQPDFSPLIGKLADRMPTLYQDTANQFRHYFKRMRDQGDLAIEDDPLDFVITNSLIIFRYYLEFALEANLPTAPGSDAVRQAFRLHLSLYEDKLVPNARAYLIQELSLDELSLNLL